MKNVFHHDPQEGWKQYFVVILLTDSSTDSAIKILTFVVLGSKSSSSNFSFPHPGYRGILEMSYRRLNNSARKYQDITGSMATSKKVCIFTRLSNAFLCSLYECIPFLQVYLEIYSLMPLSAHNISIRILYYSKNIA